MAATRRVRSRGVPLVGYTWWPLFALITWGYREGRKSVNEYLKQMGLWDLRPSPQGLERVPTELVRAIASSCSPGPALWARFRRHGNFERAMMFRSFYLAGFECATGRNMHREWIDQIAATGHDLHVDADYERLSQVGIHAVREAVRWPLVDLTAVTILRASSHSWTRHCGTAST